MAQQSYTLTRDTQATLIPAGDVLTLKQETEVFVTQSLGGTVTVQANGGLYRIAASDLDSLGEEGQATYAPEKEVSSVSPGDFSEDRVWCRWSLYPPMSNRRQSPRCRHCRLARLAYWNDQRGSEQIARSM